MNLFFFLTGSILASFICCQIDRLNNNIPLLRRHSFCESCRHPLSWGDLIPIAGYLLNRGRCRYCHKPIRPVLPLFETLGGLAFVLLYQYYGLSLLLLKYLILTILLLALSYEDFISLHIHDSLLILILLNRLLFYDGYPLLDRLLFNSLLVPVLLLVFAGVFYLIKHIKPIGSGDICLMAVLSSYFDWDHNLLILLMACTIGLVFGLLSRKKGLLQPFPFVPSISLAAFISLFCASKIIHWYLFSFCHLF